MNRLAAFLFLIGVASALPLEEDNSENPAKRSADPGIVSDIGTQGLALGDPGLGGALVSQQVEVLNNVAVSHAVGVPHPVPVPHPFPVPQPLPINVPVPVPVVKTVPVPVEHPVPYPVVRKVPVEIVRKVPVPVPHPYPVKVPVYKTRHIYYDVRPKYHNHEPWW